MPKVSIIVPCYNTEKYLHRCLDSLANQTLSDIEVLCIDDGSTDNTYTILQAYADKDKRFHIFHQDNDKGPGLARNVGLEHTTAPYIMFCDSDDWYETNMCEVMYQTIVKEQTDVVQCQTFFDIEAGYNNVSSDQRIDEKYFNLGKKGKVILDNRQIHFTNDVLWEKIFKTDTIRKSEILFKRHINFDDTIFWFCFACYAKDIYYVQEKLYHYFLRKGSIMDASVQISNQKRNDRLAVVLESILYYLSLKNLKKKYQPFICGWIDAFLEKISNKLSENMDTFASLLIQTYNNKYFFFNNHIYKKIPFWYYISESVRLRLGLLHTKGRSKEKRIEKLKKLMANWEARKACNV